jgi:hypothetical protein
MQYQQTLFSSRSKRVNQKFHANQAYIYYCAIQEIHVFLKKKTIYNSKKKKTKLY